MAAEAAPWPAEADQVRELPEAGAAPRAPQLMYFARVGRFREAPAAMAA